jgi:hypothetical protein
VRLIYQDARKNRTSTRRTKSWSGAVASEQPPVKVGSVFSDVQASAAKWTKAVRAVQRMQELRRLSLNDIEDCEAAEVMWRRLRIQTPKTQFSPDIMKCF